MKFLNKSQLCFNVGLGSYGDELRAPADQTGHVDEHVFIDEFIGGMVLGHKVTASATA